MGKTFDELQIKDDFMFGVIMRKKEFCKPFLECILGINISDIKYSDSQEIIDISANAKSVRLDVYVEDEHNTVYNIEMQTVENRNIPKRTRYYQGMIDLNMLEKGENYKNLKQSYVIFICTFDLFGKGRHKYTFENRCLQDYEIGLGDETTKIILNTKGTMDDVPQEMKNLLDYIDGKKPKDEFTEKLDKAVQSVRDNKEWRLGYMTLQEHYQEKYDEGHAEGIEHEKEETARRLIGLGKFSIKEIADVTELPIDKIKEIAELQPV